MKTYVIGTPFGEREWQAEDREHAIEQHYNAFCTEGTIENPGTLPEDEVVLYCAPADTPYYSHAEHGFDTLPWPLRADVWLWNIDGGWDAQTSGFNIETWWDGADEADLAERPEVWVRHIEDVPEGTIDYLDADGDRHRVESLNKLSTLAACERIRRLEDERAKIDCQINAAKAFIERRTGMGYDEFMDGMRRLFEPVK